MSNPAHSVVTWVDHSFKLMSKIGPQGLLPGEHSNATLHIPAGAKSFVEKILNRNCKYLWPGPFDRLKFSHLPILFGLISSSPFGFGFFDCVDCVC